MADEGNELRIGGSSQPVAARHKLKMLLTRICGRLYIECWRSASYIPYPAQMAFRIQSTLALIHTYQAFGANSPPEHVQPLLKNATYRVVSLASSSSCGVLIFSRCQLSYTKVTTDVTPIYTTTTMTVTLAVTDQCPPFAV
jgi:hypothetical protein